MGGNVSSTRNIPADETKMEENPRSFQSYVDLVLPFYYTKEGITEDELKEAQRYWNIIMNNQSAYYFNFQAEWKRVGGNPPETCSDYLFHLFVIRLLDIHPAAKPIINRIDKDKMKNHFLSMFSLLINWAAEDPTKFKTQLEALVKGHNAIGVRAVEYGIGAEIMIYAVEKCLGPNVCTPAVKNIFTKFFSKILEVVVPLSVQAEIDGLIVDRNRDIPTAKR